MRHEPATAVQSAKRIVICLVSFQASVTEEATIPSLPLFSITEQGAPLQRKEHEEHEEEDHKPRNQSSLPCISMLPLYAWLLAQKRTKQPT